MKTKLLLPLFLCMLISQQTLTLKAFTFTPKHAKPFGEEGFNYRAFLDYYFMLPITRINIRDIVDFLPDPKPEKIPVTKYVLERIPETVETKVAEVAAEADICYEDDAILLKNNSYQPPQPVIDSDKLLQMRMRQLRTPSPDLFDWMCYEFDTALENQPAPDMAATAPENQPDPSYDFNTDYDNKANRVKASDEQRIRNMAGKNNTFNPRDNGNFVVPESRMIKITGAENNVGVGVTVTYDFPGYEDTSEVLYCLNVQFYNESNFHIGSNLDLTEAEDFVCAEENWKTFEEVSKEIFVPWTKVAIINIKAKTVSGKEILYERLYLRHYMEFIDYPITCEDFITYLVVGYSVVLTEDVDCSGYILEETADDVALGLHILGNGHVVSNIEIAYTGNGRAGLIGKADSNSYISNLGIENVNISSSTWKVGGIFGELVDSSLENVYVQGGTLFGNDTVGGLVGTSTNSLIRDSYADVEAGSIGGTVGGLIGSAGTGTILVNNNETSLKTLKNISHGGLDI